MNETKEHPTGAFFLQTFRAGYDMGLSRRVSVTPHDDASVQAFGAIVHEEMQRIDVALAANQVISGITLTAEQNLLLTYAYLAGFVFATAEIYGGANEVR